MKQELDKCRTSSALNNIRACSNLSILINSRITIHRSIKQKNKKVSCSNEELIVTVSRMFMWILED
jgi:hypothetical protein